MTIEELKYSLNEILSHQKQTKKKHNFIDCESDHIIADQLILDYIGDKEIIKIFNKIQKWYS